MSAQRTSLLGGARTGRTVLGYVAMIAATIGLFYLIRAQGASLVAPPAPLDASAQPGTVAHSSDFAHVLLAIAVIIVLARLVGAAFERWLHQPPVMGEIVAGLMLGPSLLGLISPEAQAFLLPATVAPHLGIVAKIGR